MNPYQYIQQYPNRSKRLVGIEFEDFIQLQQVVEEAYQHERAQHQEQQIRINAPGGGRPTTLSLAEQLCLTLVYLRQCPTFEVLALLFGISKSKANDTFHQWLSYVQAALPASLLAQVEDDTCESAWVNSWFSHMELLVDSSEQARTRPPTAEEQRRYYSGKQKQHTYKNQFIVLPDGRDIVDVIVGEPGPQADVNLLRAQQPKFEAGQGFGGDKAYVGAPCTRTPHKKPRNASVPKAQRQANRAFAKRRIVIEHLIRIVKIFQIATQRFRGHQRTYQQIMLAVCGLVRLRLGALVLPISKVS